MSDPASQRSGLTVRRGRVLAGADGGEPEEHFGESADYQRLYEEFGITAEHVVAAAKASLARLRAT